MNERKKERKNRKGTKSKFSRVVFSKLIKVSGNYTVDLVSNKIAKGCRL